MLGWIAGAVALVAVVVAGVNLDYIKKTDTYAYVSSQIHSTGNALNATMNSMQQSESTLKLTSAAFEDGAVIPSEYTCDNPEAKNPPLEFSGVPEGTQSFVLMMEDPDVPKELRPDLPAPAGASAGGQAGGVFDHWVLYNIPLSARSIGSGEIVGTTGETTAKKVGYVPPCPPPQYEPSEHRYIFTLYALDSVLDLPAGATKQKVEAAMEGHIIGQAQLVGKYRRK